MSRTMPMRVLVVFGEMIGHAGMAAVNIRAAKIFGRDIFARRGLDQRRPAQKDGARCP